MKIKDKLPLNTDRLYRSILEHPFKFEIKGRDVIVYADVYLECHDDGTVKSLDVFAIDYDCDIMQEILELQIKECIEIC